MKKILKLLKTHISIIKSSMIVCANLAQLSQRDNDCEIKESNYWLLYTMYSKRMKFLILPFHIYYHIKYDKYDEFNNNLFILLTPIWFIPFWIAYGYQVYKHDHYWYE